MALMRFSRTLSISTQSKLIEGVLWLSSAQIIGRIARLGCSIIIARIFTPEIFGQIAIIMTCYELICTPLRRMTSAPLIKMSATHYYQSLSNAYTVNVIISGIACIIMIILSFPIAFYFQNNSLSMPIIIMALSLLLLPIGMPYVCHNLRKQRMRRVAQASLYQTIAEGSLMAILAIAGLHIWAFVIAKTSTILIWIFIHQYKNPLPKYRLIWPDIRCINLFKTGAIVGLSELIVTIRYHLDYVIIGFFLGIEALGIYFFALNASTGIAQAINQSFATALYSHLCSQTTPQKITQFNQSLFWVYKIITPVVLLQFALAYWYVPLIYGEQWLTAGAIPIFMLLCISSLFKPFAEAGAQLLISLGHNQLNIYANLIICILLLVTISIACQWSLYAVAITIVLSYTVIFPSYTYFAYHQAKLDLSQQNILQEKPL